MAVYGATKTAASMARMAAVNSSRVGQSVVVDGSLFHSLIERVFVDRLRCCWLIYTVTPSCASVVGTQYGPWVDIYQSSLYLVQHCQSIHQGRPTKFPHHTGYTSWSSVPIITVHKSGSSSLDLLHTVYICGTVWIPYR